ncbi:sensor histidine kinase [Clostridium estertheticum]|uniref:sensor histidine kinase n=1 Tax=Clostridium estertheticum TaxID=238834 RepID=UPI001CF0DD58|nr:HAMP domain-containing sensor histidine kinase [Clostridium estertheticum]MCB2338829.1 HAMP domain-containing histidine kinase [Clostridium estertheticum]
MNKITESSFKRIYIIFGSVFTFFTVAIAIFLLCIYDTTESFMLIIFAYFIVVILLVYIFITVLGKKVTRSIKTIDDIMDNAISGKKNMYTGYEEDIFSAFEGKIYRFIAMSKFATDEIENERNKIKSLISDISHQTKTPVANIMLYSELMLDGHKLNQEQKELASGIKLQSEKLRWLIESLVKMSRLETGIISSVNKTLMPVFQTISTSIGTIFSYAEKKNIQIKVCCDESIKAYHDVKWTSEAFVNILENAIKYTPEWGEIDIIVIRYEMFTRIDIKDTGIGINEGELNFIFKRFYRSVDVAQYDGVGIGLYLTREIISSEGGYIKVKSKLNKGSVFSVFLPNTK